MRRLSSFLAIVALLVAPAVVQASPAAPPGPGAYTEMTREDVRVAMRDGVELSATIWRPVTPANVKVPVILTLTPYHQLYEPLYGGYTSDAPLDLPGREFILRGYAFVVADVRGTYGSGGCWDYGGLLERHDGYDLVEWLGTRAWTNGKVGMIGASYDGTTANAAAVEAPPHLATIVPISAISRWWGYAYDHGVRATTSGENDDIDPPGDTPTDFMFAYGFVPPPEESALAAAQQTSMRYTPCDRVNQTIHGYNPQPVYDDFWKERDYLRLAHKVKVPVLVGHGLLDYNVKTWEGTQWFQALRTPKRMVLGQWPHALPRLDWNEILDQWFARWLYGVRNGVENGPAVIVQSNDREEYTRKSWGDGRRLRLKLPTMPQSDIVDDAHVTESEVLRVDDTLFLGAGSPFLTLNIAHPPKLRLSGRALVRLRASSSAVSAHFAGWLIDQAADGTRTVIARTFLNARFRASWEKPTDVVPGTPYEAVLEFPDRDWVVADGHHLQVVVAASNTTWGLPNELRGINTVDLTRSSLELPLA